MLRRISGPGKPAQLFYVLCIAATVALLGVIALLHRMDPFAIPYIQYYYMGVLSALLIHYVLDGYLFAVSNGRGVSEADNPYASPSRP